jgi:uncharacterized membrane protein YdbT with pleckstrin-like domain
MLAFFIVMSEDFLLQEGEEVHLDTKPKKKLFYLWALEHFFIGLVFGALVGNFLGIFFGVGSFFGNMLNFSLGQGIMIWILGTFSVGIVGGVLGVATAWLRYNKRRYWVTDHRVVHKKGIIGHSVSSIPLERVSDVIVSRSMMERILGFGSVHVQTLAGQMSHGSKFGAEGDLKAIPEPEKVQQLIFDLMKKKRKKENLTM